MEGHTASETARCTHKQHCWPLLNAAHSSIKGRGQIGRAQTAAFQRLLREQAVKHPPKGTQTARLPRQQQISSIVATHGSDTQDTGRSPLTGWLPHRTQPLLPVKPLPGSSNPNCTLGIVGTIAAGDNRLVGVITEVTGCKQVHFGRKLLDNRRFQQTAADFAASKP